MKRLRVLATVIVLLPFPGCDCSSEPGGPCAREDAPVFCGEPCEGDAECGPGAYCDSGGACTADCDPADACDEGQVCSADGRCEDGVLDGGDDDGGPRDANAGDAPAPDRVCASVDLAVTPTTPNVMFVVDRSGSMDSAFDGGRSRWLVLEDALFEDPAGLVTTLEDRVRFGLATYASGNRAAGECPDVRSTPVALGNRATLASEYDAVMPQGGTPTGASLDAVLDDLDTLVPVDVREDPTVLILATDGEPDTCEDGDDVTGGRLASVAAVERAFALGFRTFVISLDTGVADAHLQDLADAGAGAADARFWVATDTTGLADALETIILGEVSCDLELAGEIDPTMACEGIVNLDGMPLACDDPDGWEAVDADTIRLLGDACDQLESSGGEVTASFPCGVVLL